LAEAAGQSDCTDVCPGPNSTVACTFNYSPVVCGGGCLYANECLAEASGYDGCTTACPPPDAEAACSKEYVPILCSGCLFDNECLAQSAGFVTEDCVTLSLSNLQARINGTTDSDNNTKENDMTSGIGLAQVTTALFAASTVLFIPYFI
jgi:hypothetical protein